MIFRLIYHLLLSGLTICYLPKIFLESIRRGKRYPSLKNRFGFYQEKLQKQSTPLVWVHAVSVGETKAVSSLVNRLKKANKDLEIVVTNGTVTGHHEALKSIPEAKYYLYFPLDFSWVVRRLMKRLKPDIILITETDFWMNFLSIGKEYGAKIYLVNGKLSKKTCSRYRKLPSLAKIIFSHFDGFYLQNSFYRDRFISLGIPEDKIEVTGNLKLDHQMSRISEEEKQQLRHSLPIGDSDLVVVAGSTHKGEEESLLESFEKVWKEHPDTKLLLVPRHPERFKSVEELLTRKGIKSIKYSTRQSEKSDAKVVLVDAMGVLKTLYQIADIAIVCGSFIEHVGGHNILEPCEFGVPVLFGPHMFGQPEMVELIERFGAGRQVSPEVLECEVSDLLKANELREKMGSAGFNLIQENQGATEKTYHSLIKNQILACTKT